MQCHAFHRLQRLWNFLPLLQRGPPPLSFISCKLQAVNLVQRRGVCRSLIARSDVKIGVVKVQHLWLIFALSFRVLCLCRLLYAPSASIHSLKDDLAKM